MCSRALRMLTALVGLLVLGAAGAQSPDGVPLFNGKDLDGWVVEGTKERKDADGQAKLVWSVRDGLIVCEGSGFGFLRYDKKVFGNFALHVEYRMAPRCNSGIGIRTAAFDPRLSRETRPSFFGYEIQLLDDAGKPPDVHSSGSLYRYVAPSSNPVKPAGEWNSVDVECNGPRVRVRINGEEIVNVDQTKIEAIKNKPRQGYVCLQNHGGHIEFRNVTARELKAPPRKPMPKKGEKP
jgi:Domain of Unknown Function (DUF1080)